MIEAPKLNDEMKLTACIKFGKEYDFTGSDVRDIAEHCSTHLDGYELAKELEDNCGWSITANVVEELDCVGSYLGDEIKEARKKWFYKNDIKPPFPVGTEIKEGVITGIYDYDCAYYQVKENGCNVESRSLLMKFENATLKETK